MMFKYLEEKTKMKAFYKIENNKAQVGSGTPPDSTWVVYEVGQEPQELLDALEADSKEQSLISQIQEAKTYLASTAWYVERLSDPSSGKAIPEEVLAKRAEARELINTLEVELGGL